MKTRTLLIWACVVAFVALGTTTPALAQVTLKVYVTAPAAHYPVTVKLLSQTTASPDYSPPPYGTKTASSAAVPATFYNIAGGTSYKVALKCNGMTTYAWAVPMYANVSPYGVVTVGLSCAGMAAEGEGVAGEALTVAVKVYIRFPTGCGTAGKVNVKVLPDTATTPTASGIVRSVADGQYGLYLIDYGSYKVAVQCADGTWNWGENRYAKPTIGGALMDVKADPAYLTHYFQCMHY